jgi:glycosyltransferase involved in cell wall biosynthesis
VSSRVPTVSVIIIFLDAEPYLAEAITSVLEQSRDDWELLLVDDGSRDGSTDTARRFADADPARIRYLEHPGHANRGMSASRNLGLANARGTYVAFLDSDDVYLPERLAHHVELLERHPEADMVYGPTLYWHSWREGAAERDDAEGVLGVAPDSLIEPPTLLTAFLATGGWVLPGICSLTVKRSVATEVGGFEDAFRGCYEDQVFISRVCLKRKVFVTGRCLDKYRQHPRSCSAEAQRTGEFHPHRPHAARRRYLEWLEGHLSSERVTDPATLRALRRQLWPYRHPVLYRPLYYGWVAPRRLAKPLTGYLRRRASSLFVSAPTLRRSPG